MVEQWREEYNTSCRNGMHCRLLGQWRGTQRYEPIHRVDEDALTRAIIALGAKYGRYGYRRISALLRSAGYEVGKDSGAADCWRQKIGLVNPNTSPCVASSISRRVREIVTWSGVSSSNPICRNCRRLNESATRQPIPRSLSIPSKNPISISRKYIPGTSDGRPSFS